MFESLYKLCEKRPVSALVFLLVPALLGVIAANSLPMALMPLLNYPGLTIQTEYHGVSPDKIEEIITRPLEEAISTVGGVEQIHSTSETGKSRINIEFTPDVSPEMKGMDIRARIDLISAFFPEDVRDPVLIRYDPAQKPVLILTMDSKKRSLTEIREIAERELQKSLESVKGVSEIIVAGGQIREIMVACDMRKLRSRGLTMTALLSVLQKNNLNAAAGRVRTGGGVFPLYTRGRFPNIQAIKELIVFNDPQTGFVRLSDVARVSYELREQESASRLNGEERVSVYIFRAGGGNLLHISRRTREILKNWHKTDLYTGVTYDQSETIQKTFLAVLLRYFPGAILALFTLALFLKNLRDLACIAVSILFSAVMASLGLALLGLNYNILTLTGIALGSGLALIFGVRFSRAGGGTGSQTGPQTQTKAGELSTVAQQISLFILLLAAVFAPLVFSSIRMKTLYGGLALTLLMSACASLLFYVIAFPLFRGGLQLSLNPPRTPAIFQSLKSWAQNRSASRVELLITGFARRPLAVICVYVLVLPGSFFLYTNLKQQLSGSLEQNLLQGSIEFASGTGFKVTNKVSRKVEKELLAFNQVLEVTSRIDPSRATLTLKLQPGVSVNPELVEELQGRFKTLKGASVFFSQGEAAGSMTEATFDVLGEKLEDLDKITRSLAARAGSLPGVSQVVMRYKSPRPEVRIHVDRAKAEQSGLSVQVVGQALRYAILGGVADRFNSGHRETDIRIRFDRPDRASIKNLETFAIKNKKGEYVPLMEVARLEETSYPVKIYRKNKKRALSFTVKFTDADITKIQSQIAPLLKTELPENYRVEFDKKFEAILAAGRRFYIIAALALLLLYMTLASHFESLRMPFFALLPLPPALCASLLILSILNIPLTIPVFIGMILTAALVTAGSVMLFNEYLRAPEQPEAKRGSQAFAPLLKKALGPGLIETLAVWALFLPFILSGSATAFLRETSLTLLAGLSMSIVSTPVIVIFSLIYLPGMKSSFQKRPLPAPSRSKRVLPFLVKRKLERLAAEEPAPTTTSQNLKTWLGLRYVLLGAGSEGYQSFRLQVGQEKKLRILFLEGTDATRRKEFFAALVKQRNMSDAHIRYFKSKTSKTQAKTASFSLDMQENHRFQAVAQNGTLYLYKAGTGKMIVLEQISEGRLKGGDRLFFVPASIQKEFQNQTHTLGYNLEALQKAMAKDKSMKVSMFMLEADRGRVRRKTAQGILQVMEKERGGVSVSNSEVRKL